MGQVTRADRADGPPAAARIVLYSHDTLGFGHLRRNLMIARALRESRLDPQILMIVGMREAGAFEFPPGTDCLALPAYAKGGDGQYSPRDLGADLRRLTGLRAGAIAAAVTGFDPDLMLVDNVPRGALTELDPTLAALSARGRARIILGLRDVIDEPATMRRQWLRQRNFEALRRHYHGVWIYGDPAFYDIVAECELGSALAGRACHVGYLDHGARLGSAFAGPDRDRVLGSDPRPYVLGMVGGGRDGAALCEAFAAAPLPAGHRAILVTGSQMGADARARLHALAEGRGDLTVVDFLREPIALMQGAARIICMGGYNTVCEVLTLGRPALIVPRVRPRTEQLIRARRLAAQGLVAMLHPDDLTPAALGRWLAGPPPARSNTASLTLDLGGLDRVCTLTAQALIPARLVA